MSEQVRSCWRTPSPGVPLRNGALGGDVEQQTRDGSEYREYRPGSLHQSKSLSEVLVTCDTCACICSYCS